MKILVCLVSLYYLTSCLSVGGRNPDSVSSKGKHYVITLHGVRGNDQSYGDFHTIIRQNLEALDPAYQVVNINWTYPVGEKVVETQGKNGRDLIWTPHQISKKFNQDMFLGTNAQIKDLGPNDKISIIAYSMGGLMAMSWYYDTMFNFAGTQLIKYSPDVHTLLLKRLEKIDNVIGLGAVYWGSLDAELGWSFLEKGQLSEIKKILPKVEAFCQSPETKKIIEGQTAAGTIGSLVGWGKNKEELTTQQKNEKFVKDSVLVACNAVNYLDGSIILKGVDNVPGMILNGTKNIMTAVGNVSPYELDNMRLTSDVINEMRISRIKHVISDELRNRFRAKWTSIVGVFPCLGKSDKGLTCTGFVSEDYKRVNDGFVSLFSGVYRRETDGPVISPSAVADFLFYVEQPGKESTEITSDSFRNTQGLQQSSSVKNREIFVENMHATVTPALEALTGSLKSIGSSGAQAMKNFDSSLGVDVVLVNKECADPDKCDHPNYKHMLMAMGDCLSSRNSCNQDYLNRFYHVSREDERLIENNKLKNEMGSFTLMLNIRLPKRVQLTDAIRQNILKNIKFNFINYGTGVWGENRVDSVKVPYGLQVARPSEIASSYASVKTYSDSQVLRVYFMGRAWAKTGYVSEARAEFEKGVPVSFEVELPGVKSRNVTAVVKPAFTTYVDMYMK